MDINISELARLSFSDLEFILKHVGELFKTFSKQAYLCNDVKLREKADEYNHLMSAISAEMNDRVEQLLSSLKEVEVL